MQSNWHAPVLCLVKLRLLTRWQRDRAATTSTTARAQATHRHSGASPTATIDGSAATGVSPRATTATTRLDAKSNIEALASPGSITIACDTRCVCVCVCVCARARACACVLARVYLVRCLQTRSAEPPVVGWESSRC
jgi:hypothetical protein